MPDDAPALRGPTGPVFWGGATLAILLVLPATWTAAARIVEGERAQLQDALRAVQVATEEALPPDPDRDDALPVGPERERCLEAGMDDVLTKPFRKEELYRVVEDRGSGPGR